jgi:hypothetical protein
MSCFFKDTIQIIALYMNYQLTRRDIADQLFLFVDLHQLSCNFIA